MLSIRIYILGASGSGVTTLGAALSAKYQLSHFDVDDFYWYPTDPPYQQARAPGQRVERLKNCLPGSRWVISGSMDGWGNEVINLADLVVYIDTPTPCRIERLKMREAALFGERILSGGDMFANHQAFLTWAAGYDQGIEAGRNRPRHERWLNQLSIPVLRVNGASAVEVLVSQIDGQMRY
ncbi:adenylate kinase [Pseudomonas sp.]|uniref:adenylate kinase n=1 Tax=Pseudomonas sp. TaxID=306 RepID=UPI00345CC2C6